jgi:hypothetical protein
MTQALAGFTFADVLEAEDNVVLKPKPAARRRAARKAS